MQHLHRQPLLGRLVVAADAQAPEPVVFQGSLWKGQGPVRRARGRWGRSLVRAPGPHYLLELVQVVLLDALPREALVQAQLLLQPLQGGGGAWCSWTARIWCRCDPAGNGIVHPASRTTATGGSEAG